MCIQETKMDVLDRKNYYLLWGSNDFDFVSNLSIGRYGGILTTWDKRQI